MRNETQFRKPWQLITRTFGIAIITSLIATVASAQVIARKAVYYSPGRQALAQELADTSLPSGNSYTPRQAAIKTMDTAFYHIQNDLHANTVLIELSDDDSYDSQFGGGFPYDPIGNPHGQRAVGQEIVLDLASSHNLKVIFVVPFSDYHIFIDPTYGSHNSVGPYDFIHSVIDPTAYYGSSLSTTDLDNASLFVHGPPPGNTFIKPYYSDSRVAGWIFGGEWCVSSNGCDPHVYPKHLSFVQNYWNFFYSMVHWNGAQTNLAMIYTIASPTDYYCDQVNSTQNVRNRIDDFKTLFAPGNQMCANTVACSMPDQMGFTWYGYDGSDNCHPYPLSHVNSDLHTIGLWMANDVYGIPASSIVLSEGGSNEPDSSAKTVFFTDAISAAATINGDNPVGTIGIWNSDAYWNFVGSSGFKPNQDIYAVFNTPSNSYSAQPMSVTYPPPPAGWHVACHMGFLDDPNDYLGCDTTSYADIYGTWDFSAGLRDYGTSAANGFAVH